MANKALPVKEMEKFDTNAEGLVILRGVLVDPGTSSTNLNKMSRITRENAKFDDLGRVRIIKVIV